MSDSPNPVIERIPLDRYAGWTVRRYRDGMHDATNGAALSPGYTSFTGAVGWVREQTARVVPQAQADKREQAIRDLTPCRYCGHPFGVHAAGGCPAGPLTRDAADRIAGEVETLIPGADTGGERDELYALADHYWNAGTGTGGGPR